MQGLYSDLSTEFLKEFNHYNKYLYYNDVLITDGSLIPFKPTVQSLNK